MEGSIDMVGLTEGVSEGVKVGVSDGYGYSLGETDGCTVGIAVGKSLGSRVGSSDGIIEGSKLGIVEEPAMVVGSSILKSVCISRCEGGRLNCFPSVGEAGITPLMLDSRRPES